MSSSGRRRLGGRLRTLRAIHGLRQQDVANRARITRQAVSRAERGLGESVTVLERMCDVLGVSLRLDIRGGAELDRLIDAAHAALQERIVAILRRAGWDARVEVSFNRFGERGRIDVAAFHASSGVMLVVEVKSAIGDLQEMLGALDVKVRLAPTVGRGLGWPVRRAVPLLVLAEGTTTRRHLAAHRELFAAFGLRGRGALGWLRRPAGRADGLLVLLKSPRVRVRSTPSGRGV